MITTTKYSITSVRNMMIQIEAWIDQSEETLGNEEGKEYPNEERLDMLQARCDALQSAYDALESID